LVFYNFILIVLSLWSLILVFIISYYPLNLGGAGQISTLPVVGDGG